MAKIDPTSICHHCPTELCFEDHACEESSLPSPCEVPIALLLQTDEAEHWEYGGFDRVHGSGGQLAFPCAAMMLVCHWGHESTN